MENALWVIAGISGGFLGLLLVIIIVMAILKPRNTAPNLVGGNGTLTTTTDGNNQQVAIPRKKGCMWWIVVMLVIATLAGAWWYSLCWLTAGYTSKAVNQTWKCTIQCTNGEKVGYTLDARVVRYDHIDQDVVLEFEVYYESQECGLKKQTSYFTLDTRKSPTGTYVQACPAGKGTWEFNVLNPFNAKFRATDGSGEEGYFELYRTS